MVIEKLKDKLKTLNFDISDNISNKNNLLQILIALLFVFITICCKNLALFCVLNLLIIFSKNIEFNSEFKYKNILLHCYLLIPIFSYIYLLNINNTCCIFLWCFISILILKLTKLLYKNNLDNIILDQEKKPIFSYINLLLVAVVIGIVFSIFLKQNLFIFVLINILFAGIMILQEYINSKVKIYTNSDKKYINILLQIYNNLILIIPFVALLISINILH